MDKFLDNISNLPDREWWLLKFALYMLIPAFALLIYGVYIYVESVERRDAAYVEVIKHQREIDSQAKPFVPGVIYYDNEGVDNAK